MKTLKFSKKSWHFALAKFWDSDLEFQLSLDPSYYDICSYSKKVIGGIVKFICNLFLGTVLVGIYSVIALMFAENPLSMYLINGYPILGFFVFLFGPFLGALTILIFALSVLVVFNLFILGVKKLANFIYDYPSKKEDSFFSNSYKSWKEKFCQKIDFD